jgi:hypothetical protein
MGPLHASSAQPFAHSHLLKIKPCNHETFQPVEKYRLHLLAPTNFNSAKSSAATELFRISDMICCSNALLSGRIATSAPSFEIFFVLESLRKLPGFVIALIHPTAAFGHASEMEVRYHGI